MKLRLREATVRQFGRPTGFVGRLVGLVMATRVSNRERNRRTTELVEIQPGDRVLEIGYGRGLAIQPTDCCSAVVLQRVYHHLTDPIATNVDLLRALRPGGCSP